MPASANSPTYHTVGISSKCLPHYFRPNIQKCDVSGKPIFSKMANNPVEEVGTLADVKHKMVVALSTPEDINI